MSIKIELEIEKIITTNPHTFTARATFMARGEKRGALAICKKTPKDAIIGIAEMIGQITTNAEQDDFDRYYDKSKWVNINELV